MNTQEKQIPAPLSPPPIRIVYDDSAGIAIIPIIICICALLIFG